jgi:hypothetical protein
MILSVSRLKLHHKRNLVSDKQYSRSLLTTTPTPHHSTTIESNSSMQHPLKQQSPKEICPKVVW